ncbi:MAG: helix-turn-helix transcriptional regulator [Clostridia bacterium]|nr:helix-turn-helix transcriptional regulator [Clostridia bacterium]
MLVFDFKVIGNKLYETRNKKIMSRAEVAEKAELSERTYADIERGSVNMRLETLLKICRALNITPNDILTIEQPNTFSESDIAEIINKCSESEKQTALNLLNVYLDSLNK